MALTLRQIYDECWYLYDIKIAAGTEGTDNVIQWVHTLEDVETGEFIHGGELIFTTGIAQKDRDIQWLFDFVKEINRREACGIVVNIGPYIQEIPQIVIDYCNKEKFPLFEIPWKTRIVDMTRDFCNRIFKDEKEQEDLSEIFERILFHPDEAAVYESELQRRHFETHESFCIIGIRIFFSGEVPARRNMVQKRLQRRVARISERNVSIFRDNFCFLVLNGISHKQLEKLIGEMQKISDIEQIPVDLAVGPFDSSLDELSVDFRKVSSLLKFMKNRKETILYYDKMGVQKLLLSVDDIQVLKEFEQKRIGMLLKYDEENDTKLMELLTTYLSLNGSVQQTADKFFIHRNTVNYQLGKIKKILSCDLESMQCRFEIMLALQIRNIL